MKTLITLLLLIASVAAKAQLMTYGTLNDLKQLEAVNQAFAYVSGADSALDGKGGVYIYDSSSTATVDNYNIVKPTNVTVGRWRRANQNTFSLTQGTAFRVGSLKIFYGTGTVGANGVVTFNLTNENTSGGTAIFTQVMFANATVIVPSTNATDMTQGEWTSTAANQKTITFTFKRNVVAIGNIASIGFTPSGTNVRVFVVGI